MAPCTVGPGRAAAAAGWGGKGGQEEPLTVMCAWPPQCLWLPWRPMCLRALEGSLCVAHAWGTGCHGAPVLCSSHYMLALCVCIVWAEGCSRVRLVSDFSVSQGCLKTAAKRRLVAGTLTSLLQQLKAIASLYWVWFCVYVSLCMGIYLCE